MTLKGQKYKARDLPHFRPSLGRLISSFETLCFHFKQFGTVKFSLGDKLSPFSSRFRLIRVFSFMISEAESHSVTFRVDVSYAKRALHSVKVGRVYVRSHHSLNKNSMKRCSCSNLLLLKVSNL